jgi:hypothetical protein
MVLMAAGVGLFGTFTAMLASWFLGDEGSRVEARLDRIEQELAEIHRLVAVIPGERPLGEPRIGGTSHT